MRIGILGTRGIPNRYGGFEQFAEKLAAGLARRGHEVFVYNSSRHPYRENYWGDVAIIHCYDPGEAIGAAGQFVYDLSCIVDARKRNYDILLVLGYTSNAIWCGLYPPQTKVLLNMDGWEWKRSRYSMPARAFLRWSERVAVAHCDHLIADSPVIAQYLSGKYRRHSTCIAYGAEAHEEDDDTVPASFGLQKNNYYMIMARMVPENNIDMMLSALTAPGQLLPVLLVGNMTTPYGKQLLKKYGHREVLRCTGAIFEQCVVHNLRRNCRLYFHGHSVGGTNPSLLEAMASGARICAHDNAFSRAILGDNAAYFSNAQDISRLLKHNADEIVHPGMVAENLRTIRDSYNWETIIDQYENLFLNCSRRIHEGSMAYTG